MQTSSGSRIQRRPTRANPQASQARENYHGQEHSRVTAGIEVQDLRKSFESPVGEFLEVLRGASFSAQAGESVAITGVSGAGKTTLLNLLGGLETPDHGRIMLGKFEVEGSNLSALTEFRRTNVGFLFQFHHLLADLSAVENVALPLAIARMPWRQALDQAAQALKRAGLAERLKHAVGRLSGGEQQRVAVCRALITDPSFVFADEPTGNLDASFVVEIGKTLIDYARKRTAAVVVATHNENLAQLCDRALVLSDGKLSEAR